MVVSSQNHFLAEGSGAARMIAPWTSTMLVGQLQGKNRKAFPEEVDGVQGEATIYEGSSTYTRCLLVPL